MKLRDELLPLKGKITDEQRCRFEYEQALEATYRDDFTELKHVLDGWEEAKEDYYWDIRRGALWAEYLSLEKGRNITKSAFDRIRDRLNVANKEEERFYWASRMVHAHTVWECMAHADFSDAENETKSARSTWMDLRPYEDIWHEREFFESHVRSIEDALRVKMTTASFRLGYTSTSTNMSGNSKDYRVAYAYFLYYEEMGFPIHLPYLSAVDKQTLGKALSVMTYCSPSIAECWLLRSGDATVVQSVYNRRFLDRNTFEDVNQLYKRYLGYLNRLLQVEEGNDEPAWTLTFRSVLPEILSRLCMKASYDARVKTLDALEVIFSSKNAVRYDGLDNLVQNLMASFSKDETTKLIPRFVGMSIGKDRFGDCRLEPLYYAQKPLMLPVSVSSTVDALLRAFGKNNNEDKVILYRLIILYQCGALSIIQKKQLAIILWKERDATGFPNRTVFSRFAFLSFPYPKGINPQAILRDYFRTKPLPVMGKGTPVSIFGEHTLIFNDIKGTTNTDISFEWDDYTLNVICEQLINLWDTDKDRLLEEERDWGFSLKEELRNRLNDVEIIVTTVIAPHDHMLSDKNRTGLERMAFEFEKYGIPSLRMRIALGLMGEKNVMDREILKRMNSSDRHVIADCVSSIKLLLQKGFYVKDYVELISEYFRSNADVGRGEIIWGLCYFIEQTDLLEDETIRQNLILGLERIYNDTEIEMIDDEISTNSKMDLRKSVAPIVKAIIGNGMYDTLPSLLKWKDYYNNKETCWDIRNAFC